jgi:hypothetical protein
VPRPLPICACVHGAQVISGFHTVWHA